MNDFNPEDPKWTAYLLGELSQEEIKTIEEEIKQHPEAQEFLKGLEDVQHLLTQEFDQDESLELAALQKERVSEAMTSGKKRIPLTVWALPFAAVLVLALLFPALNPSRNQTMEWNEGGELKDSNASPSLADVERKELVDQDLRNPSLPEESLEMDRMVTETETLQEASSPLIPSEESVRRESKTELQPLDTGIVVKREGKASLASPSTAPTRDDRFNNADPFGFSGVVSRSSSAMPPITLQVRDLEHQAPGFISPSQDEFDVLKANTFRRVSDHPLSTFSIDVDTASYSVVRKMLKEGRLPPKDAVRIEELVNYFKYDYAAPTDGSPFAAHMQVMECPWAPEHHLVRVALKGQVISAEERPALNLVYLLDVSGSMSGGNRLPLVKRAMKTLVSQLDERDRVAIVVYAGAAGLVLPSTSGENDKAILEALDRLNAGGSTAGGAGIKLAYETAREQFVEGGVNRVILCTDGDFNVGLNQTGDLQKLIEEEAKSGVQLTVLGFGMGNYKDDTLETLSNKGNGNYAYIDDFNEARKVLVDDLLGNMITIAKDVKIQVEFNPAFVGAYRLVGYENRMLKKEDFNNDKVDAGEIGAGHTVTALYELVPPGKSVPGNAPAVDELKYQKSPVETVGQDQELLTLKLRHKEPDGDTSVKTEFPLAASTLETQDPDQDFRFATAVAAFGFWLREPDFRETLTLKEILKMGNSGKGMDPFGYRSEFLQLVRAAQSL